MNRFPIIVLALLLSVSFVAAKNPSLTQQQLDDVRSYVANSGVPVDYIVPLIDAAAEEMNQYIGSGTPYNLFNKFSFAQQNHIINAVQKYAYPPPPPVKAQPDPIFSALDSLRQVNEKSERNLVSQAYLTYDSSQQDNLYNSWLTYRYESLICK